MEATIFTGWIYDHLLPHAQRVKVAHPVTLTVQELAQADQLAQALVAVVVKQGQIPTATSTGNCPAPTGDPTFDSNLCSMQQYFQALGTQAATSAVRQRAAKGMVGPRPELLTKPQAALVAVVFNVAVGMLAEACEPAGGYLVYQYVVAPVVTSTFSLLATEDLPLNATQEVGDYEIAFGLTVLDNWVFDGIPVLSASKDSVEVEVALYKDITFESPTPYGMVNYEGPINPSSLDYYGSTGPLVSENIQPPTPQMPPDSLTLVLPPTSTPYTLSVNTSGSGTVNWFPTGSSFPAGIIVGLTAVPATGSTFAGWSGACSGTGACDVTMNQNQIVTASFTLASSGGSQIGVNGANVTFSGASVSCTNTGGFFDNCTGTVTLNIAVGIKNGEVAVSMDQLTFDGGNPYSAGTVPDQVTFSISGGIVQGSCSAGTIATDIEVVDGFTSGTYVQIGSSSSVPLTISCGPGT